MSTVAKSKRPSLWKRLLIATASARWLVRRACRHLIKIKIETTIRPIPTPMPPQPVPAIVQPVAPASNAEVCQVCLRAPSLPHGRSCLICQKGLPKYIFDKLKPNSNGKVPMEAVDALRPEIHAYQDAARYN